MKCTNNKRVAIFLFIFSFFFNVFIFKFVTLLVDMAQIHLMTFCGMRRNSPTVNVQLLSTIYIATPRPILMLKRNQTVHYIPV